MQNRLIRLFFFFNDTATTEIYTLSLHDALPISDEAALEVGVDRPRRLRRGRPDARSEEHTSELQSPCNLVCRLLLEKKKNRLPSIAARFHVLIALLYPVFRATDPLPTLIASLLD